MKGMIKKDLLMIKNNYRILLITLLIYILYPLMFDIDMSFFLPLMGLIVCISTLSYDEYNNWHTYVTTLPQGKINVVKSKYITTIGMIIITTLIGIISSCIMSKLKTNIILDESLYFFAGETLALVFMMSTLYPITFKFGAEKGRMFSILLYAIAMVLIKFIKIEGLEQLINNIKNFMPIIIVILSTILISISYIISKKIYLKREF